MAASDHQQKCRKEELTRMAKVATKLAESAPGPKTHSVNRIYRNRVALPDDVKRKVVEVMQERLAAASDMYSQAKFAHWNVKGDNFYQLHLVFDSVASTVEKQVDPIAERITQLGGVANGTVRQAASTSPIPEYPVDTIGGMEHVAALADALGRYCSELRSASDSIDDLGDEPTSDFFKQLVVDAEEQLYFLESHLEAGDVQ
jgi:starvation-inducible DNA-binding protein